MKSMQKDIFLVHAFLCIVVSCNHVLKQIYSLIEVVFGFF
jgi:hypothetical protein